MTYKKLFPLILPAFAAALLMATGCDLSSSTGSDLQNEVQAAVDSATNSNSSTASSAAPAAASGGVGNDIDVNSVVFLDADVSGWAQTASLRASISGGTLNLNYNQASQWPSASVRAKDGSSLNANPWVIVNVNGTYYGATFEWLKTGQTSKPTAVVTGSGGHIVQPPLNTFRPVSGQQYGFMVSTAARGGARTINERSNISVLTWP
jgi:hypothetical protein